MTVQEISHRIEQLLDSFLGAKGEKRIAMVLEYIRLKEAFEDSVAGRGVHVTDGTQAA